MAQGIHTWRRLAFNSQHTQDPTVGLLLHSYLHFRCTMEEVGSHAVSLLASLNLQRQEQAQFCDCVVTQTQSPAHFYLAHRCILAASSPVFASLLLSSSALLELQAPCLPDSVLEVVLDYIYTGTLHVPAGQQEYRSLLTAATYLQMERLHHALMDRQCDELISDNAVACTMTQLHTDTHIKPETNTSCSCSLPVSGANTINMCSSEHANILMQQDGLYYPHSAEVVRDAHRSREEMTRMEHLYSPSATGVHEEVHEEVRRSREEEVDERLCSPGGGRTGGEPSPSSSPPSCETVAVICHSGRAPLFHQTEGPALPLLCPVAQPALLASSTVITSPPIPMPSDDRKDIDEDHCGAQSWAFKDGIHFGIQNHNYSDPGSDRCGAQNVRDDAGTGQHRTPNSYHGKPFGIQDEDGGRWDCGLSQVTGYKGHPINFGSLQDDDATTHPEDDGISESTEYKAFPDEESRDYKQCKMDLGFDEFPTDRVQVEYSVAQDAFLATEDDEVARRGHGQRYGSGRSVMSHPVLCSNTDRGCLHKAHCLSSGWGLEEAESHSRLHREEIDRMDSCSSQRRAMVDRMDSASNLRRVMMDGEDGASVLRTADIDRRDSLHRAMTDRTNIIDNSLHIPAASNATFDDVMARDHVRASDGPERDEEPHKPYPSLGFEKMSDSENTQPNTPTVASVHSDVHYPAYNKEGNSYYGHLRYQCLSQEHRPSYAHPERTHLPPQHAGHPPPDQPDYSSDWEGTEGCSSPDRSPLSHHCANATGTQLLLLDISSTFGQTLGAQRARAAERGVVFGGKDRAGERGVGTTGSAEERGTEARFDVRADEGGIVVGAKCEAVDQEVGEEGARTGDEDEGQGTPAEFGFEAEVGSMVREEERDAISGTVFQVEGVSPTTSLPVCSPTSVPASRVPTTPPVCVPAVVHHPYQCTMCERSFSQRGSLNRHMRSHLGVRPYPCPRCPMTFSRQYRVTEHMRVHQRAMMEDPQRLPAPPTS